MLEIRCGSYDEVLSDVYGIDLIVTSPPYNIGSKSERKDGVRKHGRYDAKSFGAIRGYADSMPEADYQKSQRHFLEWCAEHIADNGIIVYNHKLRHRDGELISPHLWFPRSLILHDEIVWDRGSTHNHCQRFLYQHTERIYVFKKSRSAEIYLNRDELHHADVWRLPRAYQVEKNHDAPFPIELPRRCIRLWCPPDGLVCDPYAGSGTTALAAQEEQRRFVGSELLDKYVQVARRRLSQTTMNHAIIH